MPDCNGTCIAILAIGDGTCDAGLDCGTYGYDGADCTSGTTVCDPGEVPDCGTGGAPTDPFDCSPAGWLNDGDCDSYLDCPEFGNDGNDCASGGGGGPGGGSNPCNAGEVPDCNGACVAVESVGDGICDAGLDCATYGFDAADCTSGTTACDPGDVPDCATGGAPTTAGQCSSATWLFDGVCDSWLNCAAYGFDGGDCP